MVGDPDEPRPPALSHSEATTISHAFIKRLSEIYLRDCAADISRLGGLSRFEQLVIRARWSKTVELMMRVGRVLRKRYEGDRGELRLVEEIFGDQLGLAGTALKADVEEERERYKARLARRYMAKVDALIRDRNITSPIEQIFLMEWLFDERPLVFGLTLTPQFKLAIAGTTYSIDFHVTASTPGLSICVELDGHAFHEKTPQQALTDKRRERAIVKAGHIVLRFTGREVMASPGRCVDDVLAVATRVISK